MRSPLALHMPDADRLTAQEIGATLELKPAAMLCLVYAMWDHDRGVAEQISDLALVLGHDRLYVRFHSDPHPPGYTKKIGGPEAWGRLCAQRMTQYYQPLADAGIQLHAILANETDADYEGGLSVAEASDFYRRCMTEYAAKRPQDILHVPAPTGAPQTHREHLEQYKRDGWVQPHWWIDGHGYNGDLENVVNVLHEVMPGHEYVITETNDLDDFGWPISLIQQGRVRDICYFTLNWARGGEGRVQPPSADDAAKRMSLLRFPDRYAQFKAAVASTAEPQPDPQEPAPMNPYEYFTLEQIVAATDCPADAVATNWPRVVEQLVHCGINDKATQIAAIGTVAIETASTFAPVREAFWLSEAWRAANLRYYPWYGRGLIQITWEANYRAYGQKVDELWQAGGGVDLIARPDDALDPDIAAAVLAVYFRDHGGDRQQLIPEAARRGDWREVRRLVQGGSAGLDRLVAIAAELNQEAPPSATERLYSVDVPDGVVRQQNSWSCAVRATYAALWALAHEGMAEPVTYGDGGPRDVYEWLVPAYDAPNVGLLDHTGAGLAEALRQQGYKAEHAYPVSLEQVRERAGAMPVLLGGDGWHHWTYVRGRTNDGGLVLENPSPGHAGIDDYIRDSWGRLGPMAMVWIEPVAAEPKPAADYPTLVGVAYNEQGVVVPALAAALANPDDVNLRIQVDSVLRFLRANRPEAA